MKKNHSYLMKAAVMLIVFLNLNLTVCAQTWTQKTDMSTSRNGAVCFSVTDKIYVGGGKSGPNSNFSIDFWEYDPANDAWTQKGNLPRNIFSGISFSYNDKGYAGLGYDGNNLNYALYEYDPVADTWTPLASMPSNGISLMGTSRFVIGDIAYVVGGYSGGSTNQVWAYNITTNTWAQKNPFPGNIVDAMGFSIGNTGYICCGDLTTGIGICNKTYAYNPTANSWTLKAPFPGSSRQMGVAFSLNNMGYCGLGSSDYFANTCNQDFFMYDPAGNAWTPVDDYPAGKVYAGFACSLGSKAYVGGGILGLGTANYRDFYEYSAPENETGLVRDKLSADGLLLYPMPSNGEMHIKNNSAGYTAYKIIDLQGKIVAEGAISNTSIIKTKLPDGIYNLLLVSGNKPLNKRITIAN